MKYLFLSIVLSFATNTASAEIFVRDCTYDRTVPNEHNLLIAFDTEGALNKIRVGYQKFGVFFELQVRNCLEVHARGSDLFCDNKKIGNIVTKFSNENDFERNKYQAHIQLNPKRYDIYGSCRDLNNPLTLAVK